MSIHFVDVAKAYHTQIGRRVILHPTTLSVPTDRNVALLGRNGAGKSTMVRLIAGVEMPDQGHILRTSVVSWPLSFSGGLHPSLTGRQNCDFVARIHGQPPERIFESVAEFSELGPYMDLELRKYSSGMRARLAFGISLSLDFDCYLIDESLSTGDKWFRQKCLDAFDARRDRSGMLFVSHNPRQVRQYCDMALVLVNGWLVPFEDLDEAVDFYEYGLYNAPMPKVSA